MPVLAIVWEVIIAIKSSTFNFFYLTNKLYHTYTEQAERVDNLE